jgi:hypothetical protein
VYADPTPSRDRPVTVIPSDDHRAALLDAYRHLYRAMLSARTDQLDLLLDDGFSLTRITGHQQQKGEWLSAIETGRMRYHAAEERSVTIDATGDHAVLVGCSVVTATIGGARGRWHVQLAIDYAREGGAWTATRAVATTF